MERSMTQGQREWLSQADSLGHLPSMRLHEAKSDGDLTILAVSPKVIEGCRKAGWAVYGEGWWCITVEGRKAAGMK
jgi:hypothetical protein